MQLNRHYTTSKDLEKLETDIAWYRNGIGRYEVISRKDREGVTELIKLVKDSQIQSQMFLNLSLSKPTFGRYMRSAVYAAEVRVYGFILNLLENPKQLIKEYKDKLNELENQLAELKKFPKRD